MQAAEDIFGQVTGGFLADALENDIAKIVEGSAGKSSQTISQHKCHSDHRRLVGRAGHCIHGVLVSEGEG